MFYWLPVHILFSQFADKEKMGTSTGKLFAIPKFVKMFGPMIGGIIAVVFGFKALFIAAIILFSVAYIPVLRAKILPIDCDFKFKEGRALYKKYKKYFFFKISFPCGGSGLCYFSFLEP